MWEWFAGFITKTYKKTNGKPLGLKSARNHFSTMMHMAKKKCYGPEILLDAKTELFFTCLDVKSNSKSARWFRGVKKNITRYLFTQAKKTGDAVDHSVAPVYGPNLSAANKALTRHGYTFENCLRKLTLTCLRQTAGRASELGWLHLETFDFDIFYGQVFCELPESKPSKMKLCAFVAGFKPELCFFTAFGDILAHNQPFFDEDDGDVTVFFNQLANVKSVGTKIGQYLKQLRPDSRGAYKHVSNHLLDDSTAQGDYA